MKKSILFFSLFLDLLCTLHLDPQNLVYFEIKDSSSFISPRSNINTPFFEVDSKSKTFFFSFNRIRSQTKFTFSSIKHYLSNSKLIKSCTKKDSNIISLNIYSRHLGYIPLLEYEKELHQAASNKYYTPNLSETRKLIGYMFFNQPISGQQAYELKQFHIIFCSACDNSNGITTFQHFLIDKKAKAEFPQVWNTKIRVIYLGETNDCDSKEKEISRGLNLIEKAPFLSKKYTMNMVLHEMRSYLSQYPKYNVLYDGEHFATTIYNKLTGRRGRLKN